MKKPTARNMLDWVARYVSQINSLVHTGKGEKIEVVWGDETQTFIIGGVITKRGKTYIEAFEKCIIEGIRKSRKRRKSALNENYTST